MAQQPIMSQKSYLFLLGQISVSLTSAVGEFGCARAYALTSSSPSLTRLALAVSFDTLVKDGPLLQLVDDTEVTKYYLGIGWLSKSK